MKRTYDCKIRSNKYVSEDVFSLIVEKPSEMEEVKPGQFFNLQCGSNDTPLLRRPISVSFVNEASLEFIIIKKGFGTELLSELEEGKYLNLLGPLGNGYEIKESYKKILVVGGGIGVAPQMDLTRHLVKSGIEVKVLLGFRNEPYSLDGYYNHTDNVEVASENSMIGHKGFVTDLVEKELRDDKYDAVMVCGPHIMLEKTNEICKKYDTEVQLLMEERMACGVGACMVCTCKIKDDTKEEGHWNKRVCKDGPVFYGSEVIF